MKTLKLAICMLIICLAFSLIHAQTELQCGSIIEGEFSGPDDIQNYTLTLAPGDILRADADPVGAYLDTVIEIFAPTTGRVLRSDSSIWGVTESARTNELSERGLYTIALSSYGDSIGLYTLFIGCTLRDGTVINPGDAVGIPAPVATTKGNTQPQPFSGIGFPGLPPVDMSNVARIPLSGATAMTGAIASSEILGYTFDGGENSSIDLSFTRLSGNVNVGLVILAPDNNVVFQASLISSETLNTRLILPTHGQYMIGIFRVDVNPPATPEPTAFQVQVTPVQ
jgi:hypothetical protein